MKDRILQLRSQGFSYKQICEALGCTKSLVSYYCGAGQKEKTRSRNIRRRDNNPGIQAVERFQRKRAGKRRVKSVPSVKDVRDKIRSFQRREGSKLAPLKETGSTFTYHRMLEEYGLTTQCYLTGRPVDLMNSSTYSLDHIVPATRGGTNDFGNMGIACPQANWAKSDMTVEEFVYLCVDVLKNFGCEVVGEPKISEYYQP
jgi:5-methylcytosine-specific restriction endonuclease McrA